MLCPAPADIYPLSLHDALPIYSARAGDRGRGPHHPVDDPRLAADLGHDPARDKRHEDRKSTRLNSSHANISYAVFCLKKKTEKWKSLMSPLGRSLPNSLQPTSH